MVSFQPRLRFLFLPFGVLITFDNKLLFPALFFQASCFALPLTIEEIWSTFSGQQFSNFEQSLNRSNFTIREMSLGQIFTIEWQEHENLFDWPLIPCPFTRRSAYFLAVRRAIAPITFDTNDIFLSLRFQVSILLSTFILCIKSVFSDIYSHEQPPFHCKYRENIRLLS